MLKIRLSMGGVRKRPVYKIVIADSRYPRDGKFIEKIGSYNPLLPKDKKERIKVEAERVKYWMSKGAQPTLRVSRILGEAQIMSMLPGANKMKEKMDQANIDEKMLIENEALILSMTKKEKENPKIISGSRRKRIAKGSGVDVSKINKLLKQFKMMSDMMKKMSQGKKIPSGMIPDEMLNQLK